MNEKAKFGELTSETLTVGDIVEWSTWNGAREEWDIRYGIITDIKNEIKGGRLVSVSSVVPFSGPKTEVEFFTLSLRPISQAKREKITPEVNSWSTGNYLQYICFVGLKKDDFLDD